MICHKSFVDQQIFNLAFGETENNLKQQVQELKEEVMCMLTSPVEKPSQKLNLIDVLQRLGVSYHFENEIENFLQQLHRTLLDHDDQENDDDLYTVALQFRLLRQQGYYISCDKFTKFKDSNGNFKDSLINDARAMLSLYEATHLRVHGEDILDDALVFTTTHLEFVASHLSTPLAAQVSHALKQPIHKGLPRLEARHYFSIYQEDSSHDKILHTFAKSDFNILQKMHQKELSDIARWWKELNFSKKLPFIRDRVIEFYFWILGVFFEPEYFHARRILTKVIAMTSTIDDIYDVYGTFEEIELFTEAIERVIECYFWILGVFFEPEYFHARRILTKVIAMTSTIDDIYDVYGTFEEIELFTEAIERLKLINILRSLLYFFHDVYCEMEEIVGERRSDRVKYAIEAMKNQVRAYFDEAKWFHKKYIPTMDEYMEIALATSGYSLLATTSLVGMGDIVTNDSFKWVFSKPKMVRACTFEQERGHTASAVECYMAQYGATEEDAINELRKQVANAWKDINEECLYPTIVSKPIIMSILNLTRVMDVVYKDEDGYTNAGIVLKDFVTSLLIDPALLDVYCEMEEIVGERRSDRVKYAIEAEKGKKSRTVDYVVNLVNLIVNFSLYQMKNQVRAYFDEAKWFHKKYIPTMDEYMEIALATSGYSLLATTSLVGMGDIVTNDSFKWVFSKPKM
ncbi:(-)-germacrene d synthase, partial [Quercus suber]